MLVSSLELLRVSVGVCEGVCVGVFVGVSEGICWCL